MRIGELGVVDRSGRAYSSIMAQEAFSEGCRILSGLNSGPVTSCRCSGVLCVSSKKVG